MSDLALTLISLLLVVVLIFIPIAMVKYMNTRKENKKLKVVFPIQLLKPAPIFVDQYDTNTVYEYYLLENLSIGLVRDDNLEADGFTPLLASSWVKNKNSWIFKIRPDLCWSNGEKISLEQVHTHYQKLITKKSRHLQYLKRVIRVNKNEKQNFIEFVFENSPPDNFLGELALSDAVLTYPDQPEENKWKIVSGPYLIKSFSKNKIELIKNKYFQIFNDYPEEVELSIPENLSEINSTVHYDIVKESAMPFSTTWLTMPERFERVIVGSFNRSYFFKFNNLNEKDRKAFAELIRKVFKEVKLFDAFQLDSQLVPFELPERTGGMQYFNGQPTLSKKITLLIPKPILDIPGLQEAFNKYFDDKIIIETEPGKNQSVELQIFSANQKDSIWNWSFLLSGPLEDFEDELRPLFEQAAHSKSNRNKIEKLKKFNEKIEEGAFVVPVMWGRPRYFYSKRISLDKWNKFDLRMRFYLIDWT